MINLSKSIRIFFETYKDEIEMQGFTAFPKNSCQGASLLLGMMLREKFPSSKIAYVKGADINSFCHYWLEVDGLVFDITADQFEGLSQPVYGDAHQPLIEIFPILSRKPISEELLISDISNETYNHTMKVNLNLHLESQL
jgi:hypothetical protein